MTHHLITGGAGFIAVTLNRRLLERGDTVTVVDDLYRGTLDLLAPFLDHPLFCFVQQDCSDAEAMARILTDAGTPVTDVWHLAANSDIPAGIADARIDLHSTFLTTFGVLQAMRASNVGRLHFASSSAIYGDLSDVPLHEDIGPLEPISNYGAMKLASEAQIRAATEAWLERASIFRFPNVVGPPATHGVILDLIRKLALTPGQLDVLGDGTQRKAYLHVDDLVEAMLFIADAPGRYQVYNIGPPDEGVSVRFIAESVRDRVSPAAIIAYGEGSRGWVGDVPRFRYDITRLTSAGWSPRFGSSDAVTRAIDEIALQELAG
jgi:UDP-glucose 4-epimerase